MPFFSNVETQVYAEVVHFACLVEFQRKGSVFGSADLAQSMNLKICQSVVHLLLATNVEVVHNFVISVETVSFTWGLEAD